MRFGILPRRLHGPGGAAVVAANDAAPTQWRIPMVARLTDTQLVILSSASRRNDCGVDLPTNVTGEAVREAVDKLIRTALLEEVRADGSLLAWRRDAEASRCRGTASQMAHGVPEASAPSPAPPPTVSYSGLSAASRSARGIGCRQSASA